jgi:phage terminase large subunit-like protein
MTRDEKIELILLLEEKKRREEKNKIATIFSTLYPWQSRFIAETASHRACLLMAANRVGKTYTGCLIDAAHATGNYPDDWQGHKFEHAPLIWILGYSGEKIRDLLQAPLVGSYGNGVIEGGLIHKDLIIDVIPMMGTPRAVREVKVKHKSGGITRIQFWSYTQGQHALMGDSVDWYHIDEEPQDSQIYPQVLTRTATGDKGKGGRGILTFTPENGRTELVISFMDKPGASQYMQRATWDDAKHLTEETKEALLSMYPPWQRDMRTKGLPLLGTGLIFDLDMEQCKVKRFECPAHWLVINGMDFGWDHPQAHIQLWIDPDEWVIYVAHAMKDSKKQPYEIWQGVKQWAEGVPSAWPADGFQTEKGTGKTQKSYYEEAGWDMLYSHATWPNGEVSVEQAIIEIYKLIQLGKFKIMDHLSELFDEFMQFHRDESGKIVKVKDDLISAVRYAYMMRRHAIKRIDIGLVEDDYEPERSGGSWA